MVQEPTLGERAADKVTAAFGSWKFIWIQTALVLLWMILNVWGIIGRWDVYPFILLNLAFSTQAAYAAPLILLSQNRAGRIADERAESDLQADLRSEQMLERISDKLGIDISDLKE